MTEGTALPGFAGISPSGDDSVAPKAIVKGPRYMNIGI